MRYASKLVKLAHKNAFALRTYRGDCQDLGLQNIALNFADLWLPIFRYYELFQPIDARTGSKADGERKRLKIIYQQVDRISSWYKPKFDPLTSPKAIKVQKTAINQAFHQLLGLELDSHYLAILGLYGSVSIAIRDFLRHCGYGLNLQIYMPVEQELPSFAIWVGLRHNRMSARQGILSALNEKVGWANQLAALWLKSEKTVRRAYWKQQDRREPRTWLARLIRSHDEMQTLMMKRIITIDPAAQAFVLNSLAYQMYITAMRAMARLAMHLSEVDSSAADSLQHETAFRKAIESLKRNFEEILAS